MRTRSVALGAAGLAVVLGGGLLMDRAGKASARDFELTADAYPTIVVYKGPRCGCCEKWAEHLEAAGLKVEVEEVADLERVKADHGIPAHLETCHTAVAGDYVIEGHVPASSIKRLLEERPAVAGLAVPGMPLGSPGMEEGPVEDYERYSVLTFDAAGETAIYDRY